MVKAKKNVKKKVAARKNPKENTTWHKKIAFSREKNHKEWVKNVVEGKLRAALNPSVLRRTRLEKGLHQKAISDRLGISESVYGTIERGIRHVRPERAQEIAAILGKKAGELFKGATAEGRLVAKF